mgnify:CR=1 FL=1
MIKVGLLSDTHAYWDDKYAEYFKDCDEIWHAGDIGSDLLAAKFEALKPFWGLIRKYRRTSHSPAIS